MNYPATVNFKRIRSPRERIYFWIAALLALIIWTVLAIFALLPLDSEWPTLFTAAGQARECIIRQAVTKELRRVTIPSKDEALLFNQEIPLLPDGSCLDPKKLTAQELTLLDETSPINNHVSEVMWIPIGFILTLLWQIFGSFIFAARIAKNAVKVTPEQFPTIWASYQKLAARMGIKKIPDLFILNAREMNAFAIKMAKRRVIVLYSDTVEALMQDNDVQELECVLAHEMGHHALGHTGMLRHMFLSPTAYIFPLSLALSRGQELSADKVAAYTIAELAPFERAWAKLAAGKVLGSQVAIDPFIAQLKTERGLFSRIAGITQSHPEAPYRLSLFRKLFAKGIPKPPSYMNVEPIIK